GEVYQGVDYASSQAAVWTRLSAPTLRVESSSDGVVTLAWDEVANAAGYRLASRIAGEELCGVLTFEAGETSVTFEGVEDGLTYEFKIMALGGDDVYANSDYSEPVSVGAYAESLSVTSYDPETRVATIEWGAISGASKYTVKLSKDGGDTWSNYKTNLTTTSATVNGLYTGKAYALRVIGMASDGTQLDGGSEIAFAPVSVTSSVQDYKVGTPITLKLSAASNASATIQWYFVTSDGDVEIVSARDQLTYTPTSADYDIKVVTTGTGNSAPCVYTQTISRPIDAAPITVRSYDAETRVATIRWDPMPDAATYTVKISKDGGATWVDYIKKIPSKNNYKGINGIYAGKSYDFRVYGIASDGKPLERYAAGTVAPVALNSSATIYTVGEAITVRQTGAENASATIKWYSVTNEGDVEIVSARNQLTYTPTTATYDIKVVATGTGDSKGCNSTLTFTAPATISVTSYDVSTRIARLTWLPIPGAAKYKVSLSKDDGAAWQLKGSNVTTTSYDVNTVYVGRTYKFRVEGCDSTGEQVGDYLELTFTPTSDSSALLDEFFADYFEEELFEEVF
ncbi:MAG: fibronectin type III domain-containing protein, partial [Thermoguttaceae bacterium]|nr:fibronectin type III domain-containing protein [Thermoguttaceae bacterium]